MSDHGGAVAELVDQLGRLPGIGRKSAERLAFHLLRVSESEALALSEAIRRVRQDVHYCSQCFNLSESENCLICSDPGRDQTRCRRSRTPRSRDSPSQSRESRRLSPRPVGRLATLPSSRPAGRLARCRGTTRGSTRPSAAPPSINTGSS